MSNVVQLGAHDKLDVKAMLIKIIEEAEDLEDIIVVAKHKKHGERVWCSSTSIFFIAGAAVLVDDLAKCSQFGGIEQIDQQEPLG
jgi:hypothetical protein